MSVLSSIIDKSISGSFSSDVSNIGKYTFYKCSSITSASFPNVVSIGDSAFYYCSGLTSASFPNVVTIDYNAFRNCSNLTTIYIGTNTRNVCTLPSTYVFDSCPNLTNIYVPSFLVDKYKSATNWSNFADKIKAAS